VYFSYLPSPLGNIIISSYGESVYSILFGENIDPENPCPVTIQAKEQLLEYFNGSRSEFDFRTEQVGTDFQQGVWRELLNISIGKPISYTALSKRMKNPLAIRAIASANGKNKLMIVVPCHRVIGSKGELVGYAGELWRKKWLLEHEARMTHTGQSSLSF
jgi:methylated-DNA-[protein]-cysteine S-methyltransferase